MHHIRLRRLVTAAAGLALTLGILPALSGAAPGTRAVTARADDLTASQDLLRTGWDPNEPAMSPSAVGTFVQRFSTPVAGQVYAQPLVIDSLNTVVVATENDWIYGLNAATGSVDWSNHLGSAFVIGKVSALSTCTDLVPNIGVTGTPAYDPANGHVYFFANVLDSSGNPHYYLYGIDPSTGNVVQKTLISGHPSNDASLTFSATYEMERPGALVDAANGAVYGAFASHCDKKPYVGYVVRVDLSSSKAILWSDESGVTYNQAGIWQGGSGVMSDGSGRFFVSSGNGVSPAAGPGSSPPGQLAESVIRLAYSTTSGTLSPRDFFSPSNAPSLDAADTDYGAGGPVGVPFTVAGYNVLAQAGKDGRIFLLNRASLGGRKQGSGGTDADLFVSKAYGGEWGHPAIFGDTPATQANSGTTPTDNDFLVYVGKDDVMRVFRFAVTSSGKPWLTNVASSSLVYGYTSGSPVVTSHGDDATSAVIWEVDTPNTTTKSGVGSALEAYQLGKVVSTGGSPSTCTSSSPCTLQRIWHSPTTFISAKFSIPATSNGWVYVGTRSASTGTTGHVIGYSVPAAAAPATATTATFAPASVSTTTSRGVSITAGKTVTVTGATASTGASNATAPANQFTVGQVTETKQGSTTPVPVTFPVTLSPGDKLTAQVSFTPATPGATDGTLSFSTQSAAAPTVDVPLAGEGTLNGLYPQPSTVSFPLAPDQGVTAVPVGIRKPEVVDISNFGTTTQTVTSVTAPSGPFTATGLPTVGTQIKPGETISVQVTFAPASAGPATGTFTITGSSGTPATVTLSGTGAAPVSQVTAASPTVDFGTIQVGKQATAYVRISNTGNQPSLVKGTSALPAPFAARLKPAPGLPFNPSDDLAIPVTFTPTRKGSFSARYQLTWTDPTGTHSLTVTITGTAA